jgi:hypothetical protein
MSKRCIRIAIDKKQVIFLFFFSHMIFEELEKNNVDNCRKPQLLLKPATLFYTRCCEHAQTFDRLSQATISFEKIRLS